MSYCSILNGQVAYIDDYILLKNPKNVRNLGSLDFKSRRFLYFSENFGKDTLISDSIKKSTAYCHKKEPISNHILVFFNGYIDIEYNNRQAAEKCYRNFSAIFKDKIIDKTPDYDPYFVFRSLGICICLHRTKPLVRILQFRGWDRGKSFSNRFITALKKEKSFQYIYYVPGGRVGSAGCMEITN
jgi:hypothetical protein